eukprot:GHVS01053050.1.p1 GENE.GHVS01053050.1~~GHVS01053050.1.p1  ORF type:complete len:445 (+),score=106.16 GHVS01053050.1:190-1335(+)
MTATTTDELVDSTDSSGSGSSASGSSDSGGSGSSGDRRGVCWFRWWVGLARYCVVADHGLRRWVVAMFVCLVGLAVGLPYCTSAGIYLLDAVDNYLAIIGSMFIGACQAIAAGWVYGIGRQAARIGYLPVVVFASAYFIPTIASICVGFALPLDIGWVAAPCGGVLFVLIATIALLLVPNYDAVDGTPMNWNVKIYLLCLYNIELLREELNDLFCHPTQQTDNNNNKRSRSTSGATAAATTSSSSSTLPPCKTFRLSQTSPHQHHHNTSQQTQPSPHQQQPNTSQQTPPTTPPSSSSYRRQPSGDCCGSSNPGQALSFSIRDSPAAHHDNNNNKCSSVFGVVRLCTGRLTLLFSLTIKFVIPAAMLILLGRYTAESEGLWV